ncbi:MAG: tRNA (adenosine(37)-N6)-threonylcarbamoyltransferase complex transferase subunit TsaD [Flavobacteriales bacterium]|nr:tRNA (adenosine(37)-N6)-threonylcarbamoyltransferase complex transferase subunit TsaD [Flavobacteriales bacterium]
MTKNRASMAKLTDRNEGDGLRGVILGIESSCDDTAAAVLVNGVLRANVIAGQEVHAAWGGVVPELASRAHQEHIIPVVDQALRESGVSMEDIDAIAVTKGPGLMGALLVGTCFARSMAQALDVPIIGVDHVKAHSLAHFVPRADGSKAPATPFLNLTVSGGHSLLVDVRSSSELVALGSTLDDAAGEAFDKGAKLLGLPYPGGPLIDALAEKGDLDKYVLPRVSLPGLDLSFSGTKTAFRELVASVRQHGEDALVEELPHLAAALQASIVDQLTRKVVTAMERTGHSRVGLAGGVSMNSGLRERMMELASEKGWELLLLPPALCTDNAAMIAVAGGLLWQAGKVDGLDLAPQARIPQ